MTDRSTVPDQDQDDEHKAPLSADSPTSRTPLLALLRLPLFYKILIANAVIVGLVALALVIAVQRALGTDAVTDTIVLVALVGVALSLSVNAAIVRVALLPLERLERTATRVHDGAFDARAEPTALADRRFARLAATFNDMLDRMAVQRQRLREVNMRALAAAEDERTRIARELHDGTAQTLAALRVRLRLARSASDARQRDAMLDEVAEEIGTAMDEVRRMARGLRPPALDMLGLAPAIESHARSIAEAGGLRLELALESDARGLAPEAELAIYRIVQEALSNAARHSGAHAVHVAMKRTASVIEVLVRDDGHGFMPARMLGSTAQGLGLFGMQERASYLGGTVDIDSSPGRGTTVRVRIPIAET